MRVVLVTDHMQQTERFLPIDMQHLAFSAALIGNACLGVDIS
jgi:hypothetical protein